MPGEPRLHEACPLLEGRTVEASSIAKRRARKLGMPIKHRFVEECRTSHGSRANRRTVAVNLPWIWGIAEYRITEIDVQKKLETGELDAFILGIAEIDASEIERASWVGALERFERGATLAGRLQGR